MNLAPMRYANILAQPGGPIELLELGILKTESGHLIHVNASLSGIYNLTRERTHFFSEADGSGVNQHVLLAKYKAISEALERWAYYYLNQIGYLRTYGFDIEPSTTGMAAYPGLFAFQARKRAKLEAEERFCVNAWWRGRLRGEVSEHGGHSVLEIENPISRSRVILTWKEYAPGRWAYGSAAGRTWKRAHEGAWQEMELSALALARSEGIDLAGVKSLPNAGERQLLYYSLPEGYARFRERLDRRGTGWHGAAPKPVIDCNIPGPWQEYATVWRVLYPMERERGDPLETDFLY